MANFFFFFLPKDDSWLDNSVDSTPPPVARDIQGFGQEDWLQELSKNAHPAVVPDSLRRHWLPGAAVLKCLNEVEFGLLCQGLSYFWIEALDQAREAATFPHLDPEETIARILHETAVNLFQILGYAATCQVKILPQSDRFRNAALQKAEEIARQKEFDPLCFQAYIRWTLKPKDVTVKAKNAQEFKFCYATIVSTSRKYPSCDHYGTLYGVLSGKEETIGMSAKLRVGNREVWLNNLTHKFKKDSAAILRTGLSFEADRPVALFERFHDINLTEFRRHIKKNAPAEQDSNRRKRILDDMMDLNPGPNKKDLAYEFFGDENFPPGAVVCAVSRGTETVVVRRPLPSDKIVGWSAVANNPERDGFIEGWPEPYLVTGGPQNPSKLNGFTHIVPIVMHGIVAVRMEPSSNDNNSVEVFANGNGKGTFAKSDVRIGRATGDSEEENVCICLLGLSIYSAELSQIRDKMKECLRTEVSGNKQEAIAPKGPKIRIFAGANADAPQCNADIDMCIVAQNGGIARSNQQKAIIIPKGQQVDWSKF